MWTKRAIPFGRSRVPIMSLASASSKQPELLPLDTLIEEECKDDYDPRHFFPVQLGQVFRDTYRVVTKLGYGGSSTVWLAKDIHRYVCRQQLRRRLY